MSAIWRAAHWRLLGARTLFEPIQQELESRARAGLAERGPRRLGPHRVYFKASPLRPRAALRHALRHAAGLAFPRLNEFQNLGWLARHGFLAVRPLLAGVRLRAGLPRYQFLFTELVPDTPTLAEYLGAEPDAALRGALLDALARDLARLHGLGFVHRDLFPRNLLACVRDRPPRCAFLDAWRGGPSLGLRGPDHDLACFFLDGAELLGADEQRRFLDTYREESRRAGRRLSSRWPRRVQRARAAVFRRESARRPGLAPSWEFPRLP